MKFHMSACEGVVKPGTISEGANVMRRGPARGGGTATRKALAQWNEPLGVAACQYDRCSTQGRVIDTFHRRKRSATSASIHYRHAPLPMAVSPS